jgi:hypothetical protein
LPFIYPGETIIFILAGSVLVNLPRERKLAAGTAINHIPKLAGWLVEWQGRNSYAVLC